MAQVPPPKPPRGVFISQVQTESDSLEEPRRNDVSVMSDLHVSSPAHSKPPRFAGIEQRKEMIDHFRHSVQLHSKQHLFSGYEGANILESYLLSHGKPAVSRDTVIKVLDHWLVEQVIRQANSAPNDSPPFYQATKKMLYYVTNPEEHRVCMMTPNKRTVLETSNTNGGPGGVVRRSSIKRMFSIHRSNSRGRSGTPSAPVEWQDNKENVENDRRDVRFSSPSPSRAGSPWRGAINKVKNYLFEEDNSEQQLKEEARLYSAALFRLLTIVEVPVLDEMTSTIDGEKTVSLLSSILSRMGLNHHEPLPSEHSDDAMDDLLSSSKFLRDKDVLVYMFQTARICVPSLMFEREKGVSDCIQAHKWASQALKAVVHRYSTVTNNGKCPLIPAEFTPILTAISNQLIDNRHKRTRLDRALQYLYLMCPEKLRMHLNNVLHFLQRTQKTDEAVSFNNPYFLARGRWGKSENFLYAMKELSRFIVCEVVPETSRLSIIQALITLHSERKLGEHPEDLKNDLRAQPSGSCADTPAVQFCHKDNGVTDQDKLLAETMHFLLQSSKFTNEYKRKQVKDFHSCHPKAYAAIKKECDAWL